MLIKTDRWLRGDDIPASEITPQHLFDQRRRLLAAAALGAAGAALSPWAARRAFAASPAPARLAAKPNPAYATVEKPTPFDEVTTYNNFYEFGTDKSDPARYAGTLRPHPWQVSVEGLVKAPKTYDLDDLMKMAPMEERIYRLRCVEGWSMVIPWVGFPLAELIRRVEPQGSARYIQFISLADKRQMPGVSSPVLDWPYSEGLRMDEAMHPLVLLTFGLYGKGAAEPERRAGARDRAVEVRLQERQVHRPDPLCRQAAADQLEHRRAQRVRLLFQREPERRSSALEPGDRTPHRRGQGRLRRPVRAQAQDADVQRLRPGRVAVHRHGSAQVLLRTHREDAALDAAPKSLRAVRIAVWLLALVPFLRLVVLGATDRYGANPLEFVTRSTGTWTLVLLCCTLAVTPLRRLTGMNWLIRIRRMLGLYTFFYGTLHFLIWLLVDRGLDPASMVKDIAKRPFITVGFAAFVLMIPLAATSTNAMVRRLGGRRWQWLHRLVYVTGVLGILHYWWHKAGKHDFAEVSIYAAVMAVLLGLRVWWVWRGARQGAIAGGAVPLRD